MEHKSCITQTPWTGADPGLWVAEAQKVGFYTKCLENGRQTFCPFGHSAPSW